MPPFRPALGGWVPAYVRPSAHLHSRIATIMPLEEALCSGVRGRVILGSSVLLAVLATIGATALVRSGGQEGIRGYVGRTKQGYRASVLRRSLEQGQRGLRLGGLRRGIRPP